MTMQSERTVWADSAGLDAATVEALTEIAEEADRRGLAVDLPAGDVWGSWSIALEDAGAPDLAARVTALEMTELSIGEIHDLLVARGVDPGAFWAEAMGGDTAPLPRSVVERCIDEMD